MGDCPSLTFSLLAKVFAKGKMFWYLLEGKCFGIIHIVLKLGFFPSLPHIVSQKNKLLCYKEILPKKKIKLTIKYRLFRAGDTDLLVNMSEILVINKCL